MTPYAPQLISIDIAPADPSITIGAAQQFIATAHYSNSSTQDITNLAAWSSSDVTIATITATGQATGVAAGHVTIQATYDSVTGQTGLAVTVAALVGLSVTPLNITLQVGLTQQLSAIAVYDDSTQADVTGSVAWSSADPSVVTVDQTGLATAVAGGEASIQAASGAIIATTIVNVWVSPEIPPSMPSDPASLLTEAQRQLFLLLTGQLPQRIENPQLGAVQYTPTSAADLQRLIDYLQNLLAGNGSGSMTSGSTSVRKPFSFEAWP
jgi:uncharacterized protein YjdB